KVLLQHQKARHFKCSHCPRRLNTAGGLAVHIDQVHKLPTDKSALITNALPGRDTFDVEIYGMVGVPAADLEAWKRRRAEELGQTLETTKVKRPKINKGVIPIEELKKQLATHKALMSGVAAPATADILLPNDLNNASQPYPVSPFPPPGFTPGMPPMGQVCIISTCIVS
ncbi:uncharacterized protein L969DRAFT_50101, partial [Mixia osmundae IAM 14324]|uniref:uncharacterized protein n=1 Tax=Mixia osmundae (strain CBS 9802 / IAM 14324 / JCM 22182 / KY 12970) TaxID=764103 RepID=UPI0004A556C5